MPRLIALILLLTSPAMAQDGPQSALAGFIAAYRATDAASMAALFRADATFFGSSEPELLRGPEGVRGYFARAWPPGTRRGIECDLLSTRLVTPDAAVVSADCRNIRTRPDGQQEATGLRLMGVVIREGGAWRFADLHASNAPPARR